MAKIRIYELAKKLGKPNKDIIEALEALGVKDKTHSSSIEDDVVGKVITMLDKVATKKIEEKARKKAEQEARKKAAAEAKKKAEQAKKKAEEHAKIKAEQEAKRKAERKTRETAAEKTKKPAGKPVEKKETKKEQRPSQKQPVSPKKTRPEKPDYSKKQKPKPQKGAQPRKGGFFKQPTLKSLVKAAQKPDIVDTGEILPEEAAEMKVPDRFKKDIEGEKIEKFKAKASMQKAFQAIRKIDSVKKFAPLTAGKRRGKQRGGPFPGQRGGSQDRTAPTTTAPRKKGLKVHGGITVKEFSETVGVKIPDVIKKLMEMGVMANINQPLDSDTALLLADSFGIELEVSEVEDVAVIEDTLEEDESNLKPRPPIVTIMGHVDHGKTSLLDAIRETKVIDTEAGGITQHIGAYKVTLNDKDIVFLDTPGHEAFTALRARGAKVTDIVILIVAADDGVKPQTVEAIDHAKAAGVPIVVAINKVDKPEANPQRVRTELTEHGIIGEDWGGENIFAEISAKQRIGIDELLELILLQSDIMELKANPDREARGVIIEAKLDKGRGPVATVLVQSGTLNPGDAFISGTNTGKVKALLDDRGKRKNNAVPSTPVEVLGFNEVPMAGDNFSVVDDEKKARQIALARLNKLKAAEISKKHKLTLEELYSKIQEGGIKDLNIVIKGDVQGSVEAIKESMVQIKHEEVQVKVIHAAVGGINESDVMLASASNAIIIGFNVRPDIKASQVSEREGVDIELYNVIYEAIDDVKKALEGMLEPTVKEKILGRAEVRQTFSASRLGTIAGCMVIDGMISRNSDGVRVIRDNIVVYAGKIGSLKRFQEDTKEVQQGYECGILVENYNDLKVGDILENFVLETVAAKL
jgi:translation initiation factor IF-2